MFLIKFCFIILILYNLHTQTWASQNIQPLIETMISSSINSSISPCEDFYAFACGSYNEQHASNLYNDIISYVDHQYNAALLNLFEITSQHNVKQVSKPSQTFVEKTKIYLKACRQETRRNLTRYFAEVTPGLQANWPLLQDIENTSNQTHQRSSETDFDVWSLLGQLQSYGLNNVLVYQEILMGRQGEVSIMLAPFQISDKNSLPDNKVVHVLLLQIGVKNPAKVISQLKKTHKRLVNILNNLANSGNEKSLEMTFGDLEIFYPNLNLSSFLSELMDRQLPADTFVLLRNPSYFKYLNDNLWPAVEKQHLTNYLMTKFLYFLAFDGAAEFKNMACIKDLRKKFDLAVNFLFHYHKFSNQASLVEQDIQGIFKAEADMLGNYFQSNYLQLASPQISLLMDKLARVRLNVGNLPESASFDKIEDFYAKLPPLDENNYYKNHLIMLKHRFAKSLFHAPNLTHFIATDNKLGSASGAFYVPEQNMIVLPFASLLQPLYDINYNNLTKFSLLGFILAHELAHGFDTNGLYFDRLGQYSSSSKSLSAVLTNVNFQNSLKCLQKQISTESIDELVADSVAIRVVKKILNGKFKNLPPNEMPTNWQKYFFLHVAQIFCNKNNIKYVDHDADGDRLNQMVMNLDGFSLVFECSQDSKMNAQNKCRVY